MGNLTYFSGQDIESMDRFYRTNLINTLSGYKPVMLIGTLSDDNVPNLAVFENIVHIGANPPYIGFIQRPILKDFSHTYHNIIQTGVYTLNHVHKDFVENAHYTSAKFAADVSEFEACGLTMEMQEGFKAPFVAESKIKMGLRFVQEIPITLNDTKLIIGQVEHVYVQKSALMDDGRLQLNAVDDVCASGLDMYHEVKMIAEYPYAKADSIPDISK